MSLTVDNHEKLQILMISDMHNNFNNVAESSFVGRALLYCIYSVTQLNKA